MANNKITSEVDTLVPIEVSELPQLRDLYLAAWPTNMVGYYTLDTFVRWLDQRPQQPELQLFSLNGDWRSDGTFLCINRGNWIFCNTLNNSADRLQLALGLLDWSGGLKVASFMARHREAVLNVVHAKELPICVDDRLMVYYMPQAEAKKLSVNCPDNIRLGHLTGADASHIDNVWRNRYDGSVDLLRQLIELSPTIAAHDTADGQLVGWCLRFETGAMGALQVDDRMRRMGMGSVLCRAMTRQLADMGHDVFACVLPENAASRNMFEKVGFRYAEDVYWVHTEPLVRTNAD